MGLLGEMAVLRPVKELLADEFRSAVDEMVEGVLKTIPDTFIIPFKYIEEAPVFVPCREGKSLHSPVRRRSVSKRRFAGRLAGVNHGRNVTYYDD